MTHTFDLIVFSKAPLLTGRDYGPYRFKEGGRTIEVHIENCTIAEANLHLRVAPSILVHVPVQHGYVIFDNGKPRMFTADEFGKLADEHNSFLL